MELEFEANVNDENNSVSSSVTNNPTSNFIDNPNLPVSVPSNDRKVHWNCKYVQMLLDCVENRLCEFKNKSIHKKVWDDIGNEMKPYGFTTEHCYNKWKNLRRDVRMFAINPHKVTKNLDTLNRVRKLISTICPNFDPTAVYKKSIKSPKASPNKNSEESSSSLEPIAKLLTPPASPYSENNSGNGPINSHININSHKHQNHSSPGLVSGNILSNGDTGEISIKEEVQNNTNNNTGSHTRTITNTSLWLPSQHHNSIHDNNNNTTNHNNNNNHKSSCLNQSLKTNNTSNTNNNNTNNNNYASWPYELHELLLNFRAEELKQVHSIDLLINQINEIRDSSIRRINTIEQLMNLANLLINSKF